MCWKLLTVHFGTCSVTVLCNNLVIYFHVMVLKDVIQKPKNPRTKETKNQKQKKKPKTVLIEIFLNYFSDVVYILL